MATGTPCGCFVHKLQALGYDDQQVSFIARLVDQGFMAGQAKALVKVLGPSAAMAIGLAVPCEDLHIDGGTLTTALANVLEEQAMPASPEVAEAMRGDHR